MANIEKALSDFARLYQGRTLLSTGAKVVEFSGVLYNVEGSTTDPKIDGANWKALLITNGIDGDCYVTDPLPDEDGTTHPKFLVGGHMTPNADGHVPIGGISYLMPLCKWHNSPGRNRTPFEHEQTRMLELSGYMEGDIAATFAARMPGDAAYRLVSLEGDGVTVRPIDEPQLHLFNAGPSLPANGLVFHRVDEGGVVHFKIKDLHLQDH